MIGKRVVVQYGTYGLVEGIVINEVPKPPPWPGQQMQLTAPEYLVFLYDQKMVITTSNIELKLDRKISGSRTSKSAITTSGEKGSDRV